MRVVKEREGGIVRRVVLVDESGDEVVPVRHTGQGWVPEWWPTCQAIQAGSNSSGKTIIQ